MHFILFFRVVCKISNFNMWTVTHLARVCKNPMSFGKSFLYLVDFIDTRHSLLVQLTIWLAKSYNFKRLKVYETMFTTMSSLIIKFNEIFWIELFAHTNSQKIMLQFCFIFRMYMKYLQYWKWMVQMFTHLL